ncbi:MAG: hypothetical protein JNL89_11015, partial [Rhodanobacteraceae bacterium]|nr:hypothetical protein [Rhodanobacteraceae bacterium]
MSEFERLREVLLAPEQAELARLRAAEAALPERLPELLDQAERGDRREALHRALAPVVAAALTDAVRRDRRRIVDALFPVIGPAIRRAIAEALRGFAADLNRALEHSLTPRGLAWRFESWRSGVPFAQVVMKHSLRYRIDHLFLIERESGLLLHRHSAPELPDLDADAIAGMLTAIGDFVRDSVNADSDAGLASATVGEHLLQVVEGPFAVLACFIRGVPPPALLDRLRAALEDLHRAADAHPGPEPFDWDAAADGPLAVDSLIDPVEAAPPPAARWPLWLLAALLLALACAWGWRSWQRADEAARLRAAFAAAPGWELLGLHHAQRWQVDALRDPEAEAPARLLAQAGFNPGEVELNLRSYLSLAPPLLQARVQRVLAPPEGAQVELVDGQLRARGSAPAAWAEALAGRALLIPGVQSVDTSALKSISPDDPRQPLRELIDAAAALRIDFPRGRSRLAGEGSAAAEALALKVQQARAEADRLNMALRIVVYGWSDDSGSASLNARLRDRRAQELREVLVR